MRKFIQVFAIISFTAIVSCNNADKKEDVDSSTGTEAASKTPEASSSSQPKNYTASFSPDSVILGKSNQVLVKITGSNAVALSDPDGKDNGIEFVIKLQATNRNQIDKGGSISVSYSDARLQLDNGTNITARTGTNYLNAQPESSSSIESWTFEIPAGAKPSALNLFMDGTRATTNVTLK